MKDNIYKPSPDLEKEYNKALKEVMHKLKEDPLYLGTLLYLLKEERETTNRLMKTLIQKIERLEKLINEKNAPKFNNSVLDKLSEIDKKIYAFVKKRGKVNAIDIMKEFGYKGQNGASSRLNKLYNLGLLDKYNAGKKVYFMLKGGH